MKIGEVAPAVPNDLSLRVCRTPSLPVRHLLLPEILAKPDRHPASIELELREARSACDQKHQHPDCAVSHHGLHDERSDGRTDPAMFPMVHDQYVGPRGPFLNAVVRS